MACNCNYDMDPRMCQFCRGLGNARRVNPKGLRSEKFHLFTNHVAILVSAKEQDTLRISIADGNKMMHDALRQMGARIGEFNPRSNPCWDEVARFSSENK